MSSFDLNLLRPLHVLLEERSVTRAAARLNLSQPATSAALARLRRHYNNELLVRSGRSMELTPFARDLLPAVLRGITELQVVVDRKEVFDPAQTQRRFVLAATDYMTAILAGPLMKTFAREAPGASVDFVPQPPQSGDLTAFAKLDAIIGPQGLHLPGRSEELFSDDFVLIADPANSVLDAANPRLEMLRHVPHAAAYLTGPDDIGIDAVLSRAGIDHVVAARLFGLASLPLLVSGTDFVALVPRMLAARASQTLGLTRFELPAELNVAMTEAIYWHPRDDDPAVRWLREAVKRTIPALTDDLGTPSPLVLLASS
ncbi:LysR family transcriptional regulator [Promicromonospora sp. NPDC057138]|uniref:LysR family transcriptional regulator n=1 Tax=Promicromonospora sp. NPDC057138 TaxID=3346031 RepID=UPI003625654B